MDTHLAMHGVKAGFNVKDLLNLHPDTGKEDPVTCAPEDPSVVGGMTGGEPPSSAPDITDLSQAAAMTTYYDQDMSNPYTRWLQTHDNIHYTGMIVIIICVLAGIEPITLFG